MTRPPTRDLQADRRLAMGWREPFEGLLFVTHDLALAAAARASGFEVLGAKQHGGRIPAPPA